MEFRTAIILTNTTTLSFYSWHLDNSIVIQKHTLLLRVFLHQNVLFPNKAALVIDGLA